MHTIYTLGYLSSTPDDVKAWVESLDAYLVDIRFVPHSRDPRWEGEALQSLVGNEKYRYCHDLGNEHFRGGPIRLLDPAAGLREVSPLLEHRPVILLCACKSHLHCHRADAARYLAHMLHTRFVHLSGICPARAGAPSTIKVLSLIQPWASLIALGAKHIETRSWYTPYRGPLAIHASKAIPASERVVALANPAIRAALDTHNETLESLPKGVVLATCQLVDCHKITPMDLPAEPERSFGNYAPGRYAWMLDTIQPLPTPVPARGSMGLWDIESAHLQLVAAKNV